MPQLSTRHNWIIDAATISLCDETSDPKGQISKQIKQIVSEYIDAISAFLSAQINSPSYMILFCELENNNAKVAIEFAGNLAMKSVLSRVSGRAVYFVRTSAKPVKLDIATDNELTFGELDGAVLNTLATELNSIFVPLLSQTPDWGEVSSTTEFMSILLNFSNELSLSISDISGGLTLKTIPDEYQKYTDMKTKFLDILKGEENITDCFCELLENWSDSIENYVQGDFVSRSKESVLGGPRSELEYWKNRLLKINYITQQIRSKDCSLVLSFLSFAVKVNLPPIEAAKYVQNRPAIFAAIRKWKTIDLLLNEHVNESRDNVKYLTSLDKFVEPLYSANPAEIVESLPSLINACKMIYTIAKYFNTTERMQMLFVKITNQMILSCKNYILSGPESTGLATEIEEESASSDAVWTYPSDGKFLITKLKNILNLNEQYQEQYRITKDKLLSQPKGKQFDFSETAIFGRFDLFSRRVVKLIDMITAMSEFEAIASHNFDGMGSIIENFRKVKEDFRSKRHNLLDFYNNRFDRDFVELNGKLNEIELSIRQFINMSFENITSIEATFELLAKFKEIITRDSIRSELNMKYSVIFHNYVLELTNVQDQYEKLKANPPIPRQLPPVAGNITWSRHLLRRIDGPMKIFSELHNRSTNQSVSTTGNNTSTSNQTIPWNQIINNRDWKKVVRMFNKIASTIIEFETLWYRAWINSIEQARNGLQATILIRPNSVVVDPKDPSATEQTALFGDDSGIYVNLDWDIIQLIREAHCLEHLGFEIPENANVLLSLESRLKSNRDRLTNILNEYQQIQSTIRPVTFPLIRPILDLFEHRLKPGLTTISWNSLNIELFIESSEKELSKVAHVVSTVNDIVDNRIEAKLRQISKLVLVNLPGVEQTATMAPNGSLSEVDGSISLEEFVEAQETHVGEMSGILKSKSVEIEEAVDDVLVFTVSVFNDSTSPYDQSEVDAVSQEDLLKVKSHYSWSLFQSLSQSINSSIQILRDKILLSGNNPLFEVSLDLKPLNSSKVKQSSILDLHGHHISTKSIPEELTHIDSDLCQELTVESVCLSPTLESIQSAVTSGTSAVIKCAQLVSRWIVDALPDRVLKVYSPGEYNVKKFSVDNDRGTSVSSDQGNYYDKIIHDKDILKSVLFLTGAFNSTKSSVSMAVLSFSEFAWIWTLDPLLAYKVFDEASRQVHSSPKIRDFDSILKFMVIQEDKLCAMENKSLQINSLRIQCSSIVSILRNILTSKWKLKFSEELHIIAKGSLEEIFETIRNEHKKISHDIVDGDIQALATVMTSISTVKHLATNIDFRFIPIFRMYTLLDIYLPSNLLEKDEQDMRAVIKRNWDQLLELTEKKTGELTIYQNEYRSNLITTVSSFVTDVRDFRTNYEENGPTVANITPKVAVERLKRFKEELEIRVRKRDIYRLGENLFGLPNQQYPSLEKTEQELGYLSTLYDLYVLVLDTISDWKEYLWTDVPNHIDDMKAQVEVFASKCKRMPKQLRDWEAYHELKKEIDYFSEALPLLVELSKKSIQPRHWDLVKELTGQDELNVYSELFKLQSLIDAKLHLHFDEISDICDSADKQLIIEEKITEITKQWNEDMLFDFNTWKTRDYPCVLAGGKVGEIQEILEETLMNLNTMNAMRHSVPFKPQLTSLIEVLSDTADTMEKWVKVQQLWTSLESVFTGGDIAKQMPMEAKKFSQIDKDWIKIMAKSAETKNAVACCQNDLLKQFLPLLSEGLEHCQKSLDSYLEGKRNKFPRFYFVSDPVLLKILSQGSDPESIQDDFEKLFDAISRVTFDKQDKRKIIQIKTIVGQAEEIVPLVTGVNATGNIEDWLVALVSDMQLSIRRECRKCAIETGNVMNSLSIKDFADKFIGQVSLLGIQIVWTADFQDALYRNAHEKDRGIMNTVNKKFQQMLADLVGICLTDLGSGMNRTKFETLVTIHVHQRDLFTEIWKKVKEHKVYDDQDFEWLKQTRFYFKQDSDHAIVSIADVDFVYSYEYLGVKERLVITPLTDRCYLTLSQSLGMFFGGAPAGPAGTGKTETVKDMGRSLGVYVIVTNCSDQHRYKDMAKIFKGLCQAGVWGCFDEFNRIELEVLSVVAMQVESITLAKKQGAKTFMFPGEPAPILLVPSVGYFITMNPGYAGRQELPENLKVLFRSVSMMVPDREIIMRVKLASVGYTQMDLLGKKFNILYRLCEQQLSKQRHYDFGLRNILSVLRTAGGVKRSEPPETDEEMIFMRTVRDMNLSKLIADDVPLFLSLLKDLFPKVTDPPKKVYKEVEEGIVKYCKGKNLSMIDSWKLKVVQLYETSLVRHGFMLVGPTLCGKTEIMNCLTGVLTDNGSPHRVVTMNPKAITDSQMYGIKDPVSEEWTPGVFASIWAKYNNRNLKYTTWIVCDGPVDAIWIENLNTVLDDNKILTLANNDRIPMTDNCRIVFEVENLNNASPATVSRAGIIYVSVSDLGWEPLVYSWVENRQSSNAQSEKETVKTLVEQWIKNSEIFEYIRRNLKPVVTTNESISIQYLLNLITALYNGGQHSQNGLKTSFIYALIWAFGGLLENEDRVKFHDYLVKKCGPDFKSLLPKELQSSTAEQSGLTLFEYFPDTSTPDRTLVKWKAEEWKPPATGKNVKLPFSSLLIPTLDSCRAEYLIKLSCHSLDRCLNPPAFKSCLLVGAAGTAKTSTAMMYISKFKLDENLSKRVNFSSATTPFGFQKTLEGEVERKTGKTFTPPGGVSMTLFLDDMSMPLVNTWGDQVTLELTRQLIESNGFYFLDKDKRGDFKTIENLNYIGAMGHPGGGRNDIPNRAKSKFFTFNMVLPNTESVDNIYGNIIRSKYNSTKVTNKGILDASALLTSATINCWEKIKSSLLPTPQRFHYIFNMRELSRVFQGVMAADLEVVTSEQTLISLWKHEVSRVFSDKLSRHVDKDFVTSTITDALQNYFKLEPDDALCLNEVYWCDYQREGSVDPETDEELDAPRVYESAQSFDFVRSKSLYYLEKFNTEFPAKSMNLVLFDDALCHLMRITRTIQMDRGSLMLVGVGGSGKQSLTRLASFISRQKCFQITLTKTYGDNAFFDDLRELYVDAGQKGLPVTFLFTDSEIKSESFLEYLNSILATGEIAGLFQKDEKDGMCGEVRNDFVKARPDLEENLINLYSYFVDRLRDNLHIVLCFSPVNAKFPIRAQKFPAVFSAVSIDWFLPWPVEALVAVSSNFLSNYEIDTPPEKKEALYELLGEYQNSVGAICDQYFNSMRRHVYFTPKSYLCLIDFYKTLYKTKYEEVNVLERSVNVGLQKLAEAATDVEKMKVMLAEEEKKLKVAEEETNKLLVQAQAETAKAEKKAAEVGAQKDECLEKKASIEVEQEAANKDLQAALPFLHEAENAVKSITGKDITELKTLKSPSDIIRLVFDGVLLLRQMKVCDVKAEDKLINKQTVNFIHDSYDEFAKAMLSDIKFLPDLFDFSENEKDNINDETCELIEPYLNLENFDPAIAKKASGAAEGLCKWVGAMCMYHQAAKIVKPKMDFLKVQTTKLNAALEDLAAAESELAKAQAILDELNAKFNEAMDGKNKLEQQALSTKNKMDQANKLITGLAGEKIRWTEDSNSFAIRRQKLVGDVALASAFVSYCGPFNSEFRNKLNQQVFMNATMSAVPADESIDLVSFLVDQATIGEWSLHGLPSDDLSVQNGILLTRSSRYPLMIDPQGQALRWIKSTEAERITQGKGNCVTTLSNNRLKDQLEFCMSEGLCLIIENVENEVDPLLDPVLTKAIIKKGKNLYINVSDQNMDYNPKFVLYMTSRLPNPHFSPELSAKCTVIDFTVTLNGLEQQLLGRVLGMEQRVLEESLAQLLEEVTSNQKSLQILDKQLLERLSNSSGNLLDDVELIEVLANTKQKAKEVEQKLIEGEEKKGEINTKREQYRPIATRGSVLYFCMTDMTLVSNPVTLQPTGWMYNCSLIQFLEQFDYSVKNSEKCQPISKRVEKITDFLTYQVYRYMNRGLFERDKIMFKLMITLKIMTVSGKLTSNDVGLFLKAGSSLDAKSERMNPFSKWMPEKVWLNLLVLSRHPFGNGEETFFREITDCVGRNESAWKRLYDDNEPESLPVPDFEEAIVNTTNGLAPFYRLCLIRSIREDRTTIAVNKFIDAQLSSKFTAPVTDAIVDIYQGSSNRKPILYLLSAGSDPTSSIDELAKKKKKFPTDKVSMGEGQEVIALEKMKNGFLNGSWVILQNSHLGLGFMNTIEDILTKTGEIDEDFRLWITCEVTNRFPIGLLQMSLKVTLEPPMGMKAGLYRTYTTMIGQETLDKVDHEKWRALLYVQSFMHSIVQERRKFGAIGWCVPYEFNNSDLEASVLFLEKHLSSTVTIGAAISWTTVQYMVAEVQYGGRITDDLDREMFNTYAAKWFNDEVFKPNFLLNSGSAMDFNYSVPGLKPGQQVNAEGVNPWLEIDSYRNFIDELPSVDSPLIFGLHTNADLTYRQLEASSMLLAITETQPKEGGGDTGKSRDEIVKEKVQDILSKMPDDFVEEIFRSQIGKLKGPNNCPDKGFGAPLNIFLFQELQRMQNVISIVRQNLTSLVMAIDGTVVMTPDLLDDLNMIYDARIPKRWTHDASGAEISWLLPNLGGWFTGLLDRVAQLKVWLDNGRGAMKAYWLTGFTNAQGFLTGMRQEVTRQHKKDQWALDDVITHTEVLPYDLDKIKDVPDEGQNIHGLFIEGARWNRGDNRLDESEPKKLFAPMPVIYVTATTKGKTKMSEYGQYGPFDCPVYRYPRRTDKYLVFRLLLKTEQHPSHWKLRGVSLLCSTE